MPTAYAASGRKAWLTATVTVILSAALLALIAVRITGVGMTGPEVAILEGPLHGDWLDIALFKAPGSPADNDVLFVLAAKGVEELLGASDWAARLPSLAGCLLFLAGLGLAANRLFSGWGRMIGVLAVGFNPYIVDSLGLARGDALGLGFTLMGLGALAVSLREAPRRLRFWSSAWAMLFFTLAAFSRFSFAPVTAAGLLVLAAAAVTALACRPSWLRALGLIAHLAVLALLAAPLAAYVVFVMKAPITGAAAFDGRSLWALVDGTVYGAYSTSYPAWLILGWVAATVLVLPFGLIGLWREDRRHFAAVAALAAMTVLTLAGFIALDHARAYVPLPGGRPLVLLPLFTMTALSLVGLLRLPSRALVIAGGIVGALIPAWLGLHGLLSANLSVTYDSRADAATRDMMRAAKTWVEQRSPADPVAMVVAPDLAPAAEHYRRALGALAIAPITGGGETGDLLLIPEREETARQGYGVRLVARSRLSGTVLLERLPAP